MIANGSYVTIVRNFMKGLNLIHPVNDKRKYIHTYIHTYIRLLTTSPKGLFSANYKEKDKNKNIYKLFKVTIANH